MILSTFPLDLSLLDYERERTTFTAQISHGNDTLSRVKFISRKCYLPSTPLSHEIYCFQPEIFSPGSTKTQGLLDALFLPLQVCPVEFFPEELQLKALHLFDVASPWLLSCPCWLTARLIPASPSPHKGL